MRAIITQKNVKNFLAMHGIKEQELFGEEIKTSTKEMIMNETFNAFTKCYRQGKDNQFKTKYRAGGWKEYEFAEIPVYENIGSVKELTDTMKKYQIARDRMKDADKKQYKEKREKLQKSREGQEQDQEIQR